MSGAGTRSAYAGMLVPGSPFDTAATTSSTVGKLPEGVERSL